MTSFQCYSCHVTACHAIVSYTKYVMKVHRIKQYIHLTIKASCNKELQVTSPYFSIRYVLCETKVDKSIRISPGIRGGAVKMALDEVTLS